MASTPIPIGKKNQVLAVIKTHSCADLPYVRQKLVTYDDGLRILFEFSKTFDCAPTYLDELLTIFDDSELTALGIYYNKTGVTIVNPNFVVKSNNVVVNVNAIPTENDIELVNGSSVNELNINGVAVEVVSISGNSIVTKMTLDETASVGAIIVKACGSNTAALTLLSVPSKIQVGNIIADSPAVFGGYECVDET